MVNADDPTERDGATLIGSCPNPDGSTTYHYEFTPEQASDLGFEVGGFVITGYPDVPGQDPGHRPWTDTSP